MSAAVGPDHELRAYAVPITARPFRLTVGVRPTKRWLLPGPDGDAQVRLKTLLLTERRGEVVVVDDGCHDELVALTALMRHANRGDRQLSDGRPAPDDGDDRPASGDAVAEFVAQAAVTQEDFCLVQRSPADGAWRLVAACVCFPSHWRLADKMGHDLDAIHLPVPGYDQRLAVATRMFFDRAAVRSPASSTPETGPATADAVAGTGIWERFNWTLTGTDDLFCPEPSQPRALDHRNLGTQLWLRTERQTVRQVPGYADAMAFTIRTFLTPLAELTADERRALAVSLAGVSPEMARYRGSVGYREDVQEWLRSPEHL